MQSIGSKVSRPHVSDWASPMCHYKGIDIYSSTDWVANPNLQEAVCTSTQTEEATLIIIYPNFSRTIQRLLVLGSCQLPVGHWYQYFCRVRCVQHEQLWQNLCAIDISQQPFICAIEVPNVQCLWCDPAFHCEWI